MIKGIPGSGIKGLGCGGASRMAIWGRRGSKWQGTRELYHARAKLALLATKLPLRGPAQELHFP